MASAVELVECDSLEQYATVAADPAARSVLPVLREAGSSISSADHLADSLGDWSVILDRLRGSQGAKPDSPAGTAGLVVSGEGPVAVLAAVLARHTNCTVRVSPSLIGDLRRGTLWPDQGPVTIVVDLRTGTDELLVGLLDSFADLVASPIGWSRLPRFSLLTARDLPHLSQVVAKAIATAYPLADRTEASFAHLVPGDSGCLERRRILGPTGPTTQERWIPDAQVPDRFREPTTVMAVQTHGSDACARGGGGAVACGLRDPDLRRPADRAGLLGCGLGHRCPRGPQPVPLATWGADILMMTSCNGLRLADAVNVADFNLALSFLDGPGVAYVASVSSALVADACPTAFLAAVADGRSVADAVTLVNALVACSGLEEPSYVAVGLPTLTAVPPSALRRSIALPPGTREEAATVDAGDAHVTELVTDDPSMIYLVRERRLALDIRLVDGEPAYWFGRIEHPAPDAPPGTSESVRLLIMAFPTPLGRFSLQGSDLELLRARLTGAIDDLERWLDLWRLCGAATAEQEPYSALLAARNESDAGAGRRLNEARFDGGAVQAIERYAEQLATVAAGAGDVLTDLLLPKLSGSFYLTNELVGQYAFLDRVRDRCVHCGGVGSSKRFRHPTTGRFRVVRTCARCGIVIDAPAESRGRDLPRVRIEAPELLNRGESVPVRVHVHWPGVAAVIVGCRLSTHGHDARPAHPARRNLHTDPRGWARAEFVVEVPGSMPPHEYSFKALVAASHDIVFAHRLAWVR